MRNKRLVRFSASSLLAVTLFTASMPIAALAQTGAKQTQIGSSFIAPGFAAALNKIEDKLEKRRAELGIPGVALVIVKDDQIIYLKGLGYKDFDKKIAVTPDTEFAIGSATKAFTALSVLMSQEAGKLSLDDSPKKHLSYFKINDPETDAKITIRDLLSHQSGLNRTDLAMVSGKLNREEIIRVAGEAKPTAKLHEKFQYQNIMFTAAGEIVSKVNNMPWEKFVSERIFRPLGMTNSNLSVSEMDKAKDFSFGYEFNSDTKETHQLPHRNIDEVAPAGAINSSARDMANWLRFMLAGGATPDGKRLVSETAFAELFKPQMKIGGKSSYGLGWFVQDWNGNKIVQHGGNIDGFNAMVAMMPEKKLGFVLLTNVSASPLTSEMMPIVWENLIGSPKIENIATALTGNSENEIGKYRFEAAGFDIEIKMQDGKLVAVVPGQPTYTLENVGNRKYKLANAPDGFFVTFKDNEVYLEQPQGNFTLPKVRTENVSSSEVKMSASLKELIGKYESEKNASRTIEVAEKDGKVALVVEGQPPYELREKGKDFYNSPMLPDDYGVKVKRDESGKLSGIVLIQPNGEFAFNKSGEKSNSPAMTVDELMSKVTDALGGAANWKKLSSRVATFDVDLVHQGVKGFGKQYAKAPNFSATETTLTALGKQIGTIHEYFNGVEGAEEVSFAPTEKYTGKQFEDAKINADFYGLLNWKTNYKNASFKGAAKVGDEDAFVVVFEPEKGSKDTMYFSQKTFLPLKLESSVSSSTSGVSIPYTETYSDYRAVDGIMLPFRSVNSNVGNGDVITTFKEIKHNVEIPNKIFRLPN